MLNEPNGVMRVALEVAQRALCHNAFVGLALVGLASALFGREKFLELKYFKHKCLDK